MPSQSPGAEYPLAAPGRRVIFINRFFHPDHSATSQMLSDLAFALAARGHRVRIITSRQRYDDPAQRLPSHETVDGVEITRVWTSRFGRLQLAGRAIDYLTFYGSAASSLLMKAHRGDIVVTKTDPPMLSVVTSPIAWLKGARRVNWLQDIFPEVAEALALGGSRARPLYAALRWLRNRSLRSADANVVLGERMAQHLTTLGVASDRDRIIPNWADGRLIRPVDHAVNRLRSEWGLSDAFVVGYSGNLGRAHDLETFITAIRTLEASSNSDVRRRIVWLFIGGGALLGRLEAEVERLGLRSVLFKSYQPRERLAESLSAADVHLVSLLAEMEGLIVPSKLYGILAAGRPCLFIGDSDGEVARVLARENLGRTIAPGDGAALATAISALAADPASCTDMSLRARAVFDARFDKSIAVANWDRLLRELALSAVPHTPV